MDHAAHVTEMRNVCQIKKKKSREKHVENIFMYGKKVSK